MLGRQAGEFEAWHGFRPCLATVLVGGDPASSVYVRSKRRACERIGFESRHHELDAGTSQEELLALPQTRHHWPCLCTTLRSRGHYDGRDTTATGHPQASIWKLTQGVTKFSQLTQLKKGSTWLVTRNALEELVRKSSTEQWSSLRSVEWH